MHVQSIHVSFHKYFVVTGLELNRNGTRFYEEVQNR